jgi:hypothetical protein
MKDDSEKNKMNGKIAFGIDYLVIMRNLECREYQETGGDDVADAAARLFLLQWGFSIEEIDEANRIFWDMAHQNKLPDKLAPVFQRVVEFVKKDPNGVEKFITELAAVGSLNGNITDQEREYLNQFEGYFDLRPSEFYELCQRGWNWGIALNYLGEQYKAKIKNTA